jgi:hypothetical protein
LAKTTQDSKAVRFLHELTENFSVQYLRLEELTLTLLPEESNIEAVYKFIQSCQGLKRLRIGTTSLQFLSEIFCEDLSYLQFRVQHIQRQDLEGFADFFRRHRSLKRVVLCLDRLKHSEDGDDQAGDNQREGDDAQAGDDEREEHEEDEDEQEQIIKEIQAILEGIDHDVRIVDPGDRKWVE